MSKQQYVVKAPLNLGDFLLQSINGISKTSVKSMLLNGVVFVNDKVQTKYTLPLSTGQVVTVDKNQKVRRDTLNCKELTIEYEDDHIIVVNKKAGLLSVATESLKKEVTCHSILNAYVQKQHPAARVYIVHRVDRETSGLMVFAKSEKLKDYMQENWDKVALERGYLALVYGQMDDTEGTITSWLKENKAMVTYSSSTDNGGQKAITHYKVIASGLEMSLLDLRLATGRKNQIRSQLQGISHPIVGDKKYATLDSDGFVTNTGGSNGKGSYMPTSVKNALESKRLYLQAYRLVFLHPVTQRRMDFSLDRTKGIWKKFL